MPNPYDDFDNDISNLGTDNDKLPQINSLQRSRPLLHEVFEILIANRFPYLSNPEHESETRIRQTQEDVSNLRQKEMHEADIIKDLDQIHKKEIEEWLELFTAAEEEKMNARKYLETCMLILMSEKEKFMALLQQAQLINLLKQEIAGIYSSMSNKILDLFEKAASTIPNHKFTIPGTNIEISLPNVMKEVGVNLSKKIKQGLVTAENIAEIFNQEYFEQAKSIANSNGLTKEQAATVKQNFTEWRALQSVQDVVSDVLSKAQNIIEMHQPELHQKQQQLAIAMNGVKPLLKEISQQAENPQLNSEEIKERPSRDIKVVSLSSLSSSQQSEKQNNNAEENEPGSKEADANADDGLSDEERELQDLESLDIKKLSP